MKPSRIRIKFVFVFIVIILSTGIAHSQDERTVSLSISGNLNLPCGKKIADKYLSMPALFNNYQPNLSKTFSLVYHHKYFMIEPGIFYRKSRFKNWKSPSDWDLYSGSETLIKGIGIQADLPVSYVLVNGHLLRLALSPGVSLNSVKVTFQNPVNTYESILNPNPTSTDKANDFCPGFMVNLSAELKLTESLWLFMGAGKDWLFTREFIYPDRHSGSFHFDIGLDLTLKRQKNIYRDL